MRKYMAAGAAVLLLALGLCGCNRNKDAENSDSSDNRTTVSTTASTTTPTGSTTNNNTTGSMGTTGTPKGGLMDDMRDML